MKGSIKVITPLGTFESDVQEFPDFEWETLKESCESIAELTCLRVKKDKQKVYIPGPVLHQSIVILEECLDIEGE